MGGYVNYMYVFVCGNCLEKTFFTFNRSVSNAQFFFCQIYVCNGTNKEIQKKLEEIFYVYTLN